MSNGGKELCQNSVNFFLVNHSYTRCKEPDHTEMTCQMLTILSCFCVETWSFHGNDKMFVCYPLNEELSNVYRLCATDFREKYILDYNAFDHYC